MRHFLFVALLLLVSLQPSEAMMPQLPASTRVTACLAANPNSLELADNDKPAVEVMQNFLSRQISERTIVDITFRNSVAIRWGLLPGEPPSPDVRLFMSKLFWDEIGQATFLRFPRYESHLCDLEVDIQLGHPLNACGNNQQCVIHCDAHHCTEEEVQ